MAKYTEIYCDNCETINSIVSIDDLINNKCKDCGAFLIRDLDSSLLFKKYYNNKRPEEIPNNCGECKYFYSTTIFTGTRGDCALFNHETVQSDEECIVTKFEYHFGENKELVKCPNCGKKQNINASFCKDCGSEMYPKEYIKVANCDNCSKNYPVDTKFCEKDGTKLKIIELEKDSRIKKKVTKQKIIEKEDEEIVKSDIPENGNQELGFGFGNFWIGMSFIQGFLVLIFFVFLGAETDEIPNAAVGLIISTLAIGSAYGIMKRKLYGLFMVYALIIVGYGIGGALYIISYDQLDNIKGVAAIFIGVCWWIYFYKRRDMFKP